MHKKALYVSTYIFSSITLHTEENIALLLRYIIWVL